MAALDLQHAHVGAPSHGHLTVPPHQAQYSANWRPLAFQAFPGSPSSPGLDAHVALATPPEEVHGPGVLIYLLPLGGPQTKGHSSHQWGDPLHAFWCCYGSGVESMAKLADSIFFWR